MNVLKLLLYPFSALYNAVMRVRNHLYDIGHKPSFSFETAVIAVGNLNVGGSGKTPMVEYLAELLGSRMPTVTLSRGYKRETTGYRMASGDDTARTIGDEPLQMFRKFGDLIHVAVGEDRVYAIPHILQEFPETRVLLLDDAMQQRSIRPDLTILLTTFQRPFYQDFLMPFGRLRESRSGAHRADVIVITKCQPGITGTVQEEMTRRVQKYAGSKPVFFSAVEYGEPRALRDNLPLAGKVVLVTGIANAEPMRGFCSQHFEVVHHFRFADHHRYTAADLEEIDRFCSQQGDQLSILTTEKDAVKLDCPEFSRFLDRKRWFSLPIRHIFLQDGAKFDALVLNAVNRTTDH